MTRILGALLFAAAVAVPAHVQAQEWQDWGNDGWLNDDYGYYDDNFSFETDDERFGMWYGDADTDWDDSYDDVGDEGLFDV